MTQGKEKIEDIVRNVTAIMSFEDFELTEKNKHGIRRIASGQVTADEVIAEIIERYQRDGIIK